VKAMPAAVRVNSRSSSSLRSCATWIDTADSVTPSSAAASFTEPCLTTAENARSWVGVTPASVASAAGSRSVRRSVSRSRRDTRTEGGALHRAVEKVMGKTDMLANTKRAVDAARTAA